MLDLAQSPAKRTANLVERTPRFLQRLDLQQLIQVLTTVVIAAPDTEWRRDQSFLDVVADSAARDAAQFREVADGVPYVFRHPTVI